MENCVEVVLDKVMGHQHIRYGRHTVAPESIAEFTKNAFGGTVVNIGIGSVQITRRPLEPIGLGLPNEPCVADGM